MKQQHQNDRHRNRDIRHIKNIGEHGPVSDLQCKVDEIHHMPLKNPAVPANQPHENPVGNIPGSATDHKPHTSKIKQIGAIEIPPNIPDNRQRSHHSNHTNHRRREQINAHRHAGVLNKGKRKPALDERLSVQRRRGSDHIFRQLIQHQNEQSRRDKNKPLFLSTGQCTLIIVSVLLRYSVVCEAPLQAAPLQFFYRSPCRPHTSYCRSAPVHYPDTG